MVALGDLALEENLAPVRKGARVIREIAWRLREIGADGRICDLIDSQVGAIEAACGKMARSIRYAALSDAFGLIEARIAAFDTSDAPTPAAQPAEQAVASSPPAAADVPASARAAEATVPDEPAEAIAEVAEATSEPADMPAEAADAYDEAILDMVALEMAAPDPDEAAELPQNETFDSEEAAEPPPAEPIIVAEKPAPMAAPAVQPSPEPSVAPSLEASPEPSLGSSLIANGIVQRPRVPRPDPLAPIRRMSQTEKIAFFS